jgi:hypothetical protein
MSRIIFFPVTPGRDCGALKVITTKPVLIVDEKKVPFMGGVQHQFRLSIDPWDLQRIVKEANRLGREGKQVEFFGYDYDAMSVLLGPLATEHRK